MLAAWGLLFRLLGGLVRRPIQGASEVSRLCPFTASTKSLRRTYKPRLQPNGSTPKAPVNSFSVLLKLEALHPKPATLNPEPKPVLIDIGVLTVCFWLAIASVRRIDLPSAFQVMANLSILPVQFTLRPQQKASLTQHMRAMLSGLRTNSGSSVLLRSRRLRRLYCTPAPQAFGFFVVDGIA